MKEIGSEFQYEQENNSSGILLPGDVYDYGFVFCGRTAIETVLLNEPSLRKVCLPSYCCDSMIEPFRKANMEVCFYPVNYQDGFKVDVTAIPMDVDCILWCNYFGYELPKPDFDWFIKKGGIVIEDITHSFFSKSQSNIDSTYLVASLRKWEPILCGGFIASRRNNLRYLPKIAAKDSFISLRENAMKLKKEYITENSKIEKNDYLHMYFEANEWLSENYSGLSIDKYSYEYLTTVNYKEHRNRRIENANYLYNGLSGNSNIDFLFPLETMDCPLFVPILVKEGMRDAVRKSLINQSIYCPIHWPKPNADCKSNLYDIELSLICDQRYNKKDMQRIVDVINLSTKEEYENE